MSLEKVSSKLAWTAAYFLTAINTYSFADSQLPSIMIPELKAELLLTDAQIGFLFGTVFAIFFGIATLIFGRLADTPYRKNVLIFAILMWSVLTGLCGIAQQFWDLIIFRIGVGVGEAALGPIALVVLSAYFTKEKLPLALGIWGAGPFLGSALAGWGGAAMITNMDAIKPYLGFLSEFSDWRLTFFLFAIPGLIFALLLKFLPFPQIAVEKKEKVQFMPFFKKAWKFFLLMFVGVTITGLVGYSVLAWGIEMLVRVHDIPKTIAGQNFGIFNIFLGIGGSIGAGIIASKMIERGIINAHLRIAGIFVILIWVSLLLFTLSTSSFYSQVGLAGMIFFMSCGPGLYGAAFQNASPINLRGRTAAIYYISANVVGFALGPFALGFFNDYIFNEVNGYDQTGIRFSLLSLGIILYPIAALCFYKASKLFLPLEAEAR